MLSTEIFFKFFFIQQDEFLMWCITIEDDFECFRINLISFQVIVLLSIHPIIVAMTAFEANRINQDFMKSFLILLSNDPNLRLAPLKIFSRL